MAYASYYPGGWFNLAGGGTPITAAALANLDGPQYTEASLSFNPDLFTSSFVVAGFAATKDGSIANQLDVTAGTAYVVQSADGTTRQRKVAASNQTTSATSSTYYLYLQPDGTWYWSTSNSPAANSAAICTVTTDASGNILVVTDARPLTPALFPTLAGLGYLVLPQTAIVLAGNGGLNVFQQFRQTTTDPIQYDWLIDASKNLILYDSTNNKESVVIAPNAGGIKILGAVQSVGGQATAGTLGVPVIVATSALTATDNLTHTVVTLTPSGNGVYRVNAHLTVGAAGGGKPAVTITYHDATSSGAVSAYLAGTVASAVTVMNGSNAVAQGSYPLYSETVYAAGGSAVSVVLQENGASPNTALSATLERLA